MDTKNFPRRQPQTGGMRQLQMSLLSSSMASWYQASPTRRDKARHLHYYEQLVSSSLAAFPLDILFLFPSGDGVWAFGEAGGSSKQAAEGKRCKHHL
jgi:hypothetical protein